MKRSPTLSIKDALYDLWDNNPQLYEGLLEIRAKKFLEYELIKMPNQISSVDIRDGVITIFVRSSNVRNHILMEKDLIVECVNEAVGVSLIRDLIVR